MRIVLACQFQHRRRDINAAHLVEMTGKSPCQPPHAAAEIQRVTAAYFNAKRVGVEHQVPDLTLSRLEKCLEFPLAIFHRGICENCPERICLRMPIPIALKPR